MLTIMSSPASSAYGRGVLICVCVSMCMCVWVLSVGNSLGGWITMRLPSGSSGSRSLAPRIARINVFPTDADKGRQISKVSLYLEAYSGRLVTTHSRITSFLKYLHRSGLGEGV